MTLRLQRHAGVLEIPAEQWSALERRGNPFLSHEFLAALERNGCVGPRLGWRPEFIGAWRGDRLVGALPMYAKDNSYGEFVFDWSWAEACGRLGGRYYPKLVVAVPYTPATGPRILVRERSALAEVGSSLLERAKAELSRHGWSSLHVLFPEQGELELLESRDLVRRMDVQYHWENRDYRDFDDFLASLSAAKRKMIRRERRRVAEQNITVQVLHGDELDERGIDTVHALYGAIYARKWGYATLTRAFFAEVARTLGRQLVVFLGFHGGRCVAGALCFQGGGVLYGRHWGSFSHHDQLHFELCYYQGIEYCIGNGLHRFEPGAQGEHKISRGFLPVSTWSAHWIEDPRFRALIGRHLRDERLHMDAVKRELAAHSPFRRAAS